MMRIKIKLLLILLMSTFAFSQVEGNLSKGILSIDNQKKLPIKIFSSPIMMDVLQVLDNEDDVLIILNKYNTEAKNKEEQEYLRYFYNEFKTKNYWVLDKEMKEVQNPINGGAMYVLKTNKIERINAHDLQLDTEFKIWNPKEGINILGLNLRYYGLMFVIAFGLGFVLMKYMFKIDGVDEKYLDPLFTWTLFGTIFGARIGHVVFYDAHLFVDDFWSVFLPIRTKPSFEITGFAGLASHGAAIALILTTLYYSLKIIKKNPFWVYDRLGIVVALAGFFIRTGNFFNSEIIGKPVHSDSFFAIYFPQQSLDYGSIVPRYPAQLIEAVGYLVLFFVLWGLYKFTNKKYQQGWLFGLFFAVLWSIRFFAEFLKEPQGEEYISFLGLNTGQILSIPLVIGGLAVMLYSQKNKIKMDEK